MLASQREGASACASKLRIRELHIRAHCGVTRSTVSLSGSSGTAYNNQRFGTQRAGSSLPAQADIALPNELRAAPAGRKRQSPLMAKSTCSYKVVVEGDSVSTEL